MMHICGHNQVCVDSGKTDAGNASLGKVNTYVGVQQLQKFRAIKFCSVFQVVIVVKRGVLRHLLERHFAQIHTLHRV